VQISCLGSGPNRIRILWTVLADSKGIQISKTVLFYEALLEAFRHKVTINVTKSMEFLNFFQIVIFFIVSKRRSLKISFLGFGDFANNLKISISISFKNYWLSNFS